MTPDYEMDYNEYPESHYYYEDDITSTLRIVSRIRGFLFIPAVLIVHLILCVKILSNAKIRGEPWRWLIVNASICVMVTMIFGYEPIFGLFSHPKICTISILTYYAVWLMATITITLVITERFRAIQLGNEDEGGMGKKAVILCLVLFWIAIVLYIIIGQVIVPLMIIDGDIVAETMMLCHVLYSILIKILLLFLICWSFLTCLVAIIGSCVFRNRKTTTDAMKKYVMTPLLVISIFAIFGQVLYMLSNLIYIHVTLPGIMNLFFDLHCFVFALTWLITWTRKGDITWKRCCCSGNDEENLQLLEKE